MVYARPDASEALRANTVTVKFYFSEHEHLENNSTLEPILYEQTGIARTAFQGKASARFSVDDRVSWARGHNTAIEEDQAYCLMGMFDVFMIPNYGEVRDPGLQAAPGRDV